MKSNLKTRHYPIRKRKKEEKKKMKKTPVLVLDDPSIHHRSMIDHSVRSQVDLAMVSLTSHP